MTCIVAWRRVELVSDVVACIARLHMAVRTVSRSRSRPSLMPSSVCAGAKQRGSGTRWDAWSWGDGDCDARKCLTVEDRATAGPLHPGRSFNHAASNVAVLFCPLKSFALDGDACKHHTTRAILLVLLAAPAQNLWFIIAAGIWSCKMKRADTFSF